MPIIHLYRVAFTSVLIGSANRDTDGDIVVFVGLLSEKPKINNILGLINKDSISELLNLQT